MKDCNTASKRCLDVGIRLCDDIQDYMVDDIQGVNSNLIHQLKDDYLESFSNFFERLKESSYKSFLKELELKFAQSKAFNHIVAQSKPFGLSKKMEVISTKDIVGYRMVIPYHQFTEYKLKSLEYFAIQSGEAIVYVIDLLTGVTLHTQEFQIIKGRHSMNVNLTVESDRTTDFFVGVRVLSGGLLSVECDEIHDCTNCRCADECYIYDGTLKLCETYHEDDIVRVRHKPFCPNDEVSCNFERMVCEYANYFQEAYKYKVGYDILQNKLNTYDRGWYSDANTETVRDFTMPDIKEMYYKYMSLGITNIRGIMDDSVCWSCDSRSGMHLQMSSY